MRHLLAFNEPDGRGRLQANMSVEKAIALWPRLEIRGLRVDFMAVHYYPPNGDVAAFRTWLTQVHRTYRRPIWGTEFAHIDWNRPGAVSYEQNARFIRDAVRMLEDLPFVERHAWFAANPYPWKGRTPRINLMDDQLRPTPVGLAFDRVLSEVGSRQVAGLSE